MSKRSKQYNQISTSLAELSDSKLLNLLDQPEAVRSGIGGTSHLLTIEDTPVFVKKVPLTDLERQPENLQSTANLFDLPLYCHYGIGSPGFGAWRELSAHLMTTDWVISEKCSNFPILYHWRVLPASQPVHLNVAEWGSLEDYFKYWDNSAAVRHRVEAINTASHHLLLFLEYIPYTLYAWLDAQLSVGENVTGAAIQLVEVQLTSTNDFMIDNNFVHFDAHFENVLTDGHLLYFSDFGLGLSRRFELQKAEIDFFEAHRSYDRCTVALGLLHSLITNRFGKTAWRSALKDVRVDELHELSPAIASVVERYKALGLEFDEFYQQLKNESKTIAYPARQLEQLLNEIAPSPNTDIE